MDDEIWDDNCEEDICESNHALRSIMQEGYRSGKQKGEEMYRQRGFNEGFVAGRLYGNLCGEFVANCVLDVLSKTNDTSVTAHLQSELLDILRTEAVYSCIHKRDVESIVRKLNDYFERCEYDLKNRCDSFTSNLYGLLTTNGCLLDQTDTGGNETVHTK
mmetsp:Transcript_3987/g.6216  ORF Transcript_3987/g.6216 Transcript_3987/m.6216 type:complete len:160 (+) Transcript_3987:55-534(+)